LALRYFTKDSPYSVGLAHLSFAQAITIAGAASLLMYLLIVVPGGVSSVHAAIDYALLLIAMAFFNPNAWMANYIFLIMAYMALIYYLIKVNFKDMLTVVLIIISFMLASWGSESIVGNDLENILEELSTVTLAGLVLAFALFRLKFRTNLLKPIMHDRKVLDE
jgi:hypothetical protein